MGKKDRQGCGRRKGGKGRGAGREEGWGGLGRRKEEKDGREGRVEKAAGEEIKVARWDKEDWGERWEREEVVMELQWKLEVATVQGSWRKGSTRGKGRGAGKQDRARCPQHAGEGGRHEQGQSWTPCSPHRPWNPKLPAAACPKRPCLGHTYRAAMPVSRNSSFY